MSEMKKSHAQAFVILICLLITSCARLSTGETAKDKSASSGSDQKGYLHADADSVLFLHWTEINAKLNGQMNIFYAKGARGKSTDTSSHSFEGVSDGKNISLNFTGSQWTDGLGGKTWTGTISGKDLTLVIPANNGTLQPVKFSVGTVEQYNQAVLSIRQGVQDQNRKVQNENAEAARIESEKNAVVEGNNRVRSSINSLINSNNQLDSSLKFDDVFSNYAKSWEKMKKDHRNLQDKAAETPLTSYKLGQVQYLLGGLQYDVGIFESHSGNLDYKIARAKDAINSIRETQKSLKDSWAFLQGAVAGNSSGSPVSQFTEGDISEPLRSSEEKIQKASQAIQQASQQRSQYNGQAKDLYKNAEAFVKSLKAVD
jgi:hypothetical protein